MQCSLIILLSNTIPCVDRIKSPHLLLSSLLHSCQIKIISPSKNRSKANKEQSSNIMISKARLLALLNLAAYLLNTLETFGYGPFSSHFTPTQNNATISDKYQTIITPFGFAFSIWGLIFLMQAIFCVVCLDPKTGSEELSEAVTVPVYKSLVS